MSFPRYPKYKDSGVEWLGEVPEHWGVQPLKYAARLVTDRADARVNAVALENIEGWTGRLLPTDSEFQGDGVAFRPGDLLFGKLRPYLAKAWLADSHGEAVGDFHVLRPNASDIVGRFLQYQVLSTGFISIIDGSTFGSKMPRASWEALGGMTTTRPPVAEQRAIAAFLDRETARIDALVAEQERLIKLLREKRQAVISHAVTKGLDPNVPMKDSGVEWLGEVPAHWSTPPLYARYSQSLGKMLDSARITGEHPTPYLRNVDVRWDFINTEDLPVMDIAPDERERYSVRAGDLLLVEGRELGRGAIWKGPDGEVAFQKALHRLRPLSWRENVRFMYYTMVFANGTGVFFADQTPNEIPHLTGEELRRYRFPAPPIEEQDAIVMHLDRAAEQFDLLTAQVQDSITLLQERRTALISAAVTGQIDVRNVRPEEHHAGT